jgi:hypothetical protein
VKFSVVAVDCSALTNQYSNPCDIQLSASGDTDKVHIQFASNYPCHLLLNFASLVLHGKAGKN